jgi:hypothetical protein
MFGKTLVFMHLGLSITFATWALVLYTNRINWTDKNEGELVARMSDYNRLAKYAVRPADERFREARKKVQKEEDGQPRERAWYKVQEEFLTSGNTDANPIQQIDRDAGGAPIVLDNPPALGPFLQMGPLKDKDGQPAKNRDGQPLVLKSLDFYNREYNTLLTQESDYLKRRKDAAQKELDFTNELKDTDGVRGLQSKILLEVSKRERVEDEYAEIRPLILNTLVENQNLEDLRHRLEQRKSELEKVKNRGDRQGP